MSLDNIVSKILDDAQLKAHEVRKKALESSSVIIKEAEAKAEALSWEIIKETKQKIAVENRRFEVNQSIEHKKAILEKKQAMIGEAFEKAKDELANLDDDKYRALLKNILLFNVEKGDETLLISPVDARRITDGLLKLVNNELAKTGKAGKLKLKIDDGVKENSFILEGKNTRLDVGLEPVLAELREEIDGEVAKILFKEK